jgi:hypothetical protein
MRRCRGLDHTAACKFACLAKSIKMRHADPLTGNACYLHRHTATPAPSARLTVPGVGRKAQAEAATQNATTAPQAIASA